jgi:excisionase family DNA binding protein
MTQTLIAITEADLTSLTDAIDRIERRLAQVEMRPQKDLLTADEMAELVGKSKQTIKRWAEAGKLETVEVGDELMFPRPKP